MKTSATSAAGLVLAAALASSTTGCRINHYGTRAAASEPGEQALCKATCDRLIEDQAIPSGASKACQSACLPRDAAPAPTKTVAVHVVDGTCQSSEDPCSRETCGPRGDAPCPCKKAGRHARAAAAPPPACQVDWDCPGDLSCEAGSCR